MPSGFKISCIYCNDDAAHFVLNTLMRHQRHLLCCLLIREQRTPKHKSKTNCKAPSEKNHLHVIKKLSFNYDTWIDKIGVVSFDKWSSLFDQVPEASLGGEARLTAIMLKSIEEWL